MKPKHLLLLLLLVPIDFISYTQITQLLRQPSDSSVAFGAIFLVALLLGNLIIIRFLILQSRRP